MLFRKRLLAYFRIGRIEKRGAGGGGGGGGVLKPERWHYGSRTGALYSIMGPWHTVHATEIEIDQSELRTRGKLSFPTS